LVGAAAVTVLAALGTLPYDGTGWADGVPYNDPAAKGTLTLCDDQLKPVTTGDVRDLPFVTYVISSQPATGVYAVKNAKATLYVFQPKEGTDPGDWHGTQLSGSSYFSTTQHPMVEVTTGDKVLLGAIQNAPSMWGGYYQLRLYLNAQNQGTFSDTYPTLDIHVSGMRWTAVDGGRTACTAGKAYSTERLVLKQSAFPSPSKATPAPSGSASTGASASATASPSDTTPNAVAAANENTASGSGDSSGRTLWILLALLVVGAGAAVFGAVRSRNRPG
jgi:hypothetical protein